MYDQAAAYFENINKEGVRKRHAKLLAQSSCAAREDLHKLGISWKMVVNAEAHHVLRHVIVEGLPLVAQESSEAAEIIQ